MAQFSLRAGILKQLTESAASPTSQSAGAALSGRSRRAPRATAQWLAPDKATALGDEFELGRPQGVAVEAFYPSGAIEHVAAVAELPFESDPPDAAKFLRVDYGGASAVIAMDQLALSEPRVGALEDHFGSDSARFVFPIFAERFASAEPFFDAVRSLHTWILGVPPFNTSAVADNFALHAYFWPTDPVRGQFNTHDIIYDCDRPPGQAVIFHGDNGLAKAALSRLMLRGRYGLILVNSGVRGGAGGVASSGFPAWASITACRHERWEAVALHEIGHALGLADEYVDVGRANERPLDEPNCATSEALDAAPWSHHYSERPPSGSSVYSLERQRQLRRAASAARPASDFVGLFQGARYSANYYRPSLNCLMRETSTHWFCPVCADAIRLQVAAA